MTKEIKLCRDCKHSMPEPGSEWAMRCTNKIVNARDPYALATGALRHQGSSALEERKRPLWIPFSKSPCGMRGALWEPKQ